MVLRFYSIYNYFVTPCCLHSCWGFRKQYLYWEFPYSKEMINLIPFTTIENTFQQTLPTMPTIIQIFGNVLLLCPLSFSCFTLK